MNPEPQSNNPGPSGDRPHQSNQSNHPSRPRPGGPPGNNRPGSQGGNRRPGGDRPYHSRRGPNRSGGTNQGPGGRPGPRGPRPKGKRPSIGAVIQNIARGTSSIEQGKANQASAPSTQQGGGQLNQLDNRDSGMLYPGSKFQEQPHQMRDRGDRLRVIPLGGLGEVGMNCMAIEYGNDIIVVDVGWMFPDETMPGIDYVIPDVSYLEKKKQNIRGILITHGHLDHIGAAPFLLPQLGFPKVYATQLARAITESNLIEHNLQDKVQWQTVKYADILHLGPFRIEFFHVNHNIPEGMGIAITTPVGTIVHTGDFKFDETPVVDAPAEFEKIRDIGKRGVLLAMNDSTNTERPGHTASESEIGNNLRKLISDARGRVIMATFSTLVARLQEAMNAAAANNRKVTIVGRSMLKNVEIYQRLGYLDIPKDILVDSRNLKGYRDSELLIICTGSQADEMSALVRMSTGEHKQIQINQGDTVILSSTPIPGNERSIENMMDNLFRQGADVMYSKELDIHTSGHAYQDELKQMLEMLAPQHFMPIHGEYRKRVMHGRLAQTVGISPHNVHLLDNGRVLEINHKGDVGMTKEKVGGGTVFVDGLGVGDVGNIVLRDRRHMAEAGMCVIIVTISRKNGQLIGSPDIISRGFIYLRESGDLLGQVRTEVRKLVTGGKGQPDRNAIKNKLREGISEVLFEKTQRRPLVMPVLIEV